MEDTKGEYGDTMEFHCESLKAQVGVETYRWLAFTLSMKAVAVFAEKQ